MLKLKEGFLKEIEVSLLLRRLPQERGGPKEKITEYEAMRKKGKREEGMNSPE